MRLGEDEVINKDNNTENKDNKDSDKTVVVSSKKKKAPKTIVDVPATTKSEKNVVANKKTKTKISSKKLPKMMKKNYTEKKYKKKLLGKIFLEDDKKYVSKLFEKNTVVKKNKKGKVVKTLDVYSIPSTEEFAPSEIARLKKIAKQIKKQRGRFKIGLIITVVCLVLVIIFGTDFALKFAAEKSLEAIFGAKANVSYAHANFFNSSVSFNDITVANKDKPYYNLVEFSSIVIDININEILDKKVYIDEISALGLKLDTERKTSGALPNKKTKSEVTASNEPSFDFKTQIAKYGEEGVNRVVASLESTFSNYNPETILSNYYDNLQTPIVVQASQEQIEKSIEEWKLVPNQITEDVTAFTASIQNLANANYTNIKTISELEQTLKTVDNAIKTGQSLEKTVTSTVNKIDSDSKVMTSISRNLQTAITNDTNLAKAQINSIASFSFKDNNLVTQALDFFFTDLLGEYYPIVKCNCLYRW